MAVKTITITETAYDSIKKLKFKDESFSKLFIRLVKEKSPVGRLFGAMPMTKKESAELRSRVKRVRKELSDDLDRRRRRFFK